MDLVKTLDDLRPGMVLSRSVKQDGRMLLPSGRELSYRDIQKLADWNVETVYVRPSETETAA